MPLFVGSATGFIPGGGSAVPGPPVIGGGGGGGGGTAAPAIPTGLVVVSTTDTSISLDWNNSPDLRAGDKYQIYQNGIFLSPEATVSNYTISSGLAPGTTYSIRVSAGQMGSYGDWTDAVLATTTGGAAATNRPVNPALIAYTNGASTTFASQWAHPGALIITRDNYNESWVVAAANAGATVLVYLDTIVLNAGINRYSGLLYNSNSLGGAVPAWPGPLDSGWGAPIADFRAGGTLQAKLPGVIDLLVSENPHVSGVFLDDLGTRSWFGGFSWDGLGSTAKEQWRDGAIAIATTMRNKANQHNLFLVANGFWGPDTSGATAGDGGYPNRTLPGCSLLDGIGVEMHDPDSEGTSFWAVYAGPTAQTGSATPRGLPYYFFIQNALDDLNDYVALNLPAFGYVNNPADYATIYNPWTTSFTDFKIPNRKL